MKAEMEPAAAEARQKVAELSRSFAEAGADVDRAGKLPVANLRRLFDAGLSRLYVPAEFGGAASSSAVTADLRLNLELINQIARGESSTAQVWGLHFVITRMVFGGLLDVSDDLKRRLAKEILAGARLSNAAAEGGKQRRDFATTVQKTAGGVCVNGTKIFATGSEGSQYMMVPAKLAGSGGGADGGLVYVLVPTGAAGVEIRNDWDNMGQRGTASHSVVFNNVVLPEEYLLPIIGGAAEFYGPRSIFGPFFQMAINASILGMGLGAFDVIVQYVRNYARPNLPTIEHAYEDPLNLWHVGRLSAQLAAAEVLQGDAAERIQAVEMAGGDRAAASVQMMRAKVITNDAVLETTGQLHRLAGGRATANQHRLDRFWRNARTLTVHDSVDAKLQQIGAFAVNETAPPASMIS